MCFVVTVLRDNAFKACNPQFNEVKVVIDRQSAPREGHPGGSIHESEAAALPVPRAAVVLEAGDQIGEGLSRGEGNH